MVECSCGLKDKIADTVVFMVEQSKGNLTESDSKALILCSKILTKHVLEICWICQRPLTRLPNNQLICYGCNRESPL